jgi:hypothetical protein
MMEKQDNAKVVSCIESNSRSNRTNNSLDGSTAKPFPAPEKSEMSMNPEVENEKLNEEILLIMFAGMSMNRGARNTIKKALNKARQQGFDNACQGIEQMKKVHELELAQTKADERKRIIEMINEHTLCENMHKIHGKYGTCLDVILEKLENSEAMEK